jgi:hypothetical protein
LGGRAHRRSDAQQRHYTFLLPLAAMNGDCRSAVALKEKWEGEDREKKWRPRVAGVGASSGEAAPLWSPATTTAPFAAEREKVEGNEPRVGGGSGRQGDFVLPKRVVSRRIDEDEDRTGSSTRAEIGPRGNVKSRPRFRLRPGRAGSATARVGAVDWRVARGWVAGWLLSWAEASTSMGRENFHPRAK